MDFTGENGGEKICLLKKKKTRIGTSEPETRSTERLLEKVGSLVRDVKVRKGTSLAAASESVRSH